MKEKFLSAIAQSAAVAVFCSGAYVVGSGVSSIMKDSYVAAANQAAANGDSEVADATASGIKKVLKSLLR